jgi:dTDP-4-amino-4,6-dideoxygalactose transaminase
MATNSHSKPAALGGTPIFPAPIPFNRPTLPPFEQLSDRIEEVFASGQLTNGPNVAALEAKAAAYFGRPAVAVGSCTSGLILTAKLLEFTGQVIVPSFTFFATSHALLWNGLRPLFVDIKDDSWNIDPQAVERAINPQVSAIFAVDIFGNPSDKQALSRIAERHGLKLVTDAAHALGGSYQGRPVGGFGDAEVFSLSPTKLAAAGEGGLVSVSDAALAERLKVGRDYGNPGDYNCRFIGLNARMPEISAVVAAGAIDMLAENVEKRQNIAERYRRNLADLPGLTWQAVAPGDRSTYKDVSVLVDPAAFGLNRDALAAALAAEGVPTRKYFYPPAHRQSAYEGLCSVSGGLEVTDKVSANILSLPVYSHMDKETIDKICLAVARIQAAGGLIT